MSDYMIVTDSASDLSIELIKKAEVKIVSMCFTLDNRLYYDYPDRSDMDPKHFYNILRKGGMATTNAVNVNDFIETMEPILSIGKDILLIAFSSGLSSTYNSAVMAAKVLKETYPHREILVCDSLCASMGQGLLVWLAVQEQKKGKNINQVFEWVENHKLNICHQFTVDDLGHLKRGGRISGISAALGGALSIKPILQVDNQGHLVNSRKVRGRKASLNALVDEMESTACKNVKQTIFISHGDCLADVEYVANLIKAIFEDVEIYSNTIGPVIGSHTGANVVALFYQGEKR